MSPENDQNPQPSNPESALPESTAQTVSSPSFKNSGAEAQSATGVAAAVAVAREPELPAAPPEPQPPAVQSSDTASSDSPSGVVKPTVGEATEPAIAADSGASAEVAESAESNETMDQLLDQFAVPEASAAEGEISTGACWP